MTWKTLRILVALLLLCLANSFGQIPASFQGPIVGYVLDTEAQGIRPILGIPGSSRIDAPLNLNLKIVDAVFLPDEKHALVKSAEVAETLVLDLEAPFGSAPVLGAPSSVTAMRASRDGTKAGLYYSLNTRLLIVGGLPSTPVVQSTIDLSSQPPLTRYAVSNDGALALLVFHEEESDALFRWTPGDGFRFLTTASRISDVIFLESDALFADSQSNEVVLIRDVAEQPAISTIADSHDDILNPTALSVSIRNELYIGSAGGVFVVDRVGQTLKKLVCSCAVSAMAPLHNSALRLTDELYQPLFILDGRTTPERILFVPALSVETHGIVP